jgi:hypothetical protein
LPGDTPDVFLCPQAVQPAQHDLTVLDATLFGGPWVLIDAHSVSVGTAPTYAAAMAELAEHDDVTSVVGTLRGKWQVVDVDPDDKQAPAEAGDACAEDLRDWAEHAGLARVLRRSGRPGHHHVLIEVPDELYLEYQRLVRQARAHHGVGATPRRSVRVLSAPHRLGLPCPVVDVVVNAPVDEPAVLASPPTRTARGRRTQRASHSTHKAARRRRREHQADGVDRSPAEFGLALALARAGYATPAAWQAANTPGSVAADEGELWWRRWMWCKAVTWVAAEQQLGEDEAWARAQLACRAVARQLGRDAWRTQYWEPGVVEAGLDRPRRYRRDQAVGPAQPRPVAGVLDQVAEQDEVTVIHTGMVQAAEDYLTRQGRRAQFRASVRAVLAPLAEVIVRRAGSISHRELAERSGRDTKTVRAALNAALTGGILYRAARYTEGAKDCDRWGVGPAAQGRIERLRETSPTRCTPPPRPPPEPGTCDPTRLTRQHRADRAAFSLRLKLSEITEVTGETYAECQHPVAKLIRSRHAQRHWWQSLTAEQQEERRAACRARLDEMAPDLCKLWFDWLARRDGIDVAIDGIVAGDQCAAYRDVVERAPLTVSLGRRDPLWLTGGTPARPLPVGKQLELGVMPPTRPPAHHPQTARDGRRAGADRQRARTRRDRRQLGEVLQVDEARAAVVAATRAWISSPTLIRP